MARESAGALRFSGLPQHQAYLVYTSGSTGKPKGVLHTTGGYLLQAAMTFKYVFDYREGEVYWCTADVGWVTGHTYIVYGPLANGAISLMFEGVPTYPDAGRCWEVVDKHQVNTFYTAPTAIRALHAVGDEPPLHATGGAPRWAIGTRARSLRRSTWRWCGRRSGGRARRWRWAPRRSRGGAMPSATRSRSRSSRRTACHSQNQGSR